MKKIYLQIILFLNLFVVIIWYYPRIVDFMITYNRHYSIPTDKNEIDLIAERGTFGDMFGLLNTVFSGIALLSVVYTIYEEKEKTRREKKEFQQDRLAYFVSILDIFCQTGNSVLTITDSYIFEIGENSYNYDIYMNIKMNKNVNRLETVIKNINEQEYFLAYVQNISLQNKHYDRAMTIHFTLDILHEVPRLINQIQKEISNSKDEIFRIKSEIEKLLETVILDEENSVDKLFLQSYVNWFTGKNRLIDLFEFFSDINDTIRRKFNTGNTEFSSAQNAFIEKRLEIHNKFRAIEDLIKEDLKQIQHLHNLTKGHVNFLQARADTIKRHLNHI